jgi:hypothetical protein
MARWLEAHPSTRLIVVDTWARIRGRVAGKDRYQEEYAALAPLQRLAIDSGVAVVLVHHLRKEGADDWLEALSGSQAITGACDTLLGLFRERGQMDATLRLVSRDAEEFDLALRFNAGRWESLGSAADYRHTAERTAVLEALRDLDGQGKVSDVAVLVGKSAANTSKLLVGLWKEGAVRKVKYGVYALVEVVEPGDLTSTTSTTSTEREDQGLLLRDDELIGFGARR